MKARICTIDERGLSFESVETDDWLDWEQKFVGGYIIEILNVFMQSNNRHLTVIAREYDVASEAKAAPLSMSYVRRYSSIEVSIRGNVLIMAFKDSTESSLTDEEVEFILKQFREGTWTLHRGKINA
jgi:hypothetical protein